MEMRTASPKPKEEHEPEKRRYSKLREVRIERGTGGVMVHHRHETNDGSYKEPPPPTIIGSHDEFMDHMTGVSKRMGLSGGKEAEMTEGEEE